MQYIWTWGEAHTVDGHRLEFFSVGALCAEVPTSNSLKGWSLDEIEQDKVGIKWVVDFQKLFKMQPHGLLMCALHHFFLSDALEKKKGKNIVSLQIYHKSPHKPDFGAQVTKVSQICLIPVSVMYLRKREFFLFGKMFTWDSK